MNYSRLILKVLLTLVTPPIVIAQLDSIHTGYGPGGTSEFQPQVTGILLLLSIQTFRFIQIQTLHRAQSQ